MAVSAVLFAGLGYVVGNAGGGSAPNVNDLGAAATASPSATPTPGATGGVSLPILTLGPPQATLGPGPGTIPAQGGGVINVVGCGSSGDRYSCLSPTSDQAEQQNVLPSLGAYAVADESAASSLVTPAPTTEDSRRAAVYLHALTLGKCASGGCSAQDSNLARTLIVELVHLRITSAVDAYNLWAQFESNPCAFVAPYPPDYEHPASCYNPLDFGQLTGVKDTTPSEDQFVAWGRQQAVSSLVQGKAQDIVDALPASIIGLTPTDTSVAQATGVLDSAGRLTSVGSTVVGGGATGSVAGFGALAANGSAAEVPLFNAVFPYAAKVGVGQIASEVAARAAAELVGAASASVGIVLTAGAILIQRAIDLADAVNPSQVTQDLTNDVQTARGQAPTLSAVAADPTREGALDLLDVLAAGYGAHAGFLATTTWTGNSGNVLTNPGGESNDPAVGLAHRDVFGWNDGGTGATVRAFADPSTDPSATCGYFTGNSLPCADPQHMLTQGGSGNNYFWGGVNNASSSLKQSISFNSSRPAKSFAIAASCLSAHGGQAGITLTFSGGKSSGTQSFSCPSTQSIIQSAAKPLSQSGSVPSGATGVVIALTFNRGSSSPLSDNGQQLYLTNNDSGLDNVSLTLSS